MTDGTPGENRGPETRTFIRDDEQAFTAIIAATLISGAGKSLLEVPEFAKSAVRAARAIIAAAGRPAQSETSAE